MGHYVNGKVVISVSNKQSSSSKFKHSKMQDSSSTPEDDDTTLLSTARNYSHNNSVNLKTESYTTPL
jgi:hypothetical protein